MKGKRFSEEQIIRVLKEFEAGTKAKVVCRKHGISDATLYTWRRKYKGMEVNDAKKYRKLEDECKKLRRLVADLSLDNQVLKEIVEKKL
jgi:putative transposase